MEMISALVWLILFVCNSCSLAGSLNNEGFALLSFKHSIANDPEASMNNWNSSDDTPCLWNGITCKEGKVVSISIPKKKLVGFLPSVLGSLSSLRHLNLRSNNFFASLPVELFRARGLQSLVLYGNSFSGSIPPEIGELVYLQILDLSNNFLSGSIPSSLIDCRRLRTLDLSHNNFSGPLPVGFATGLSALEKLDLSFNRLNGSIPNDVGNLTNLQETVDVSHNLFTGSIPANLGKIPEKVFIDLTYNNLSGPIPQNGSLVNRGPTGFIGNPWLCGTPLRNPCSSETSTANTPSSLPYMPKNYPSQTSDDNAGKVGRGRGLSKSAVIAIVVSDVVGICLIGLLFSYFYWRVYTCGKEKDEDLGNFEKGSNGRKDCLCFRRYESDTLVENCQHCDLILLDTEVAFDLDELLRATAVVLGKSGIGIVYKVVLEDGLTLAVRRFGEGGSRRFKEFQTEVEAIAKVRHPNIVKLIAYFWSIDDKLLIYDYIPYGNLDTAIHGQAGMASFRPLPWSTRLKIMKGIAEGLAYLHEFSSKKYVHGDLKPNNILLGQNFDPYISDFGIGYLANIAGGSPTFQSPQQPQQQMAPLDVVTACLATNLASCYQAPESMKVLKPSQKWDVYSYGVILLEMISGRLPLIQVGSSEIDIVQWIQLCIEEMKPLSDVIDPYLAQDLDKEEEMIAILKIALACVQASPGRRPLMRHVSDALVGLGTSTH